MQTWSSYNSCNFQMSSINVIYKKFLNEWRKKNFRFKLGTIVVFIIDTE